MMLAWTPLRKSWLAEYIAAIAGFTVLWSSGVNAQPLEITSRSALNGNDLIDWSQFPESDNDTHIWLSNPFQAMSNSGLAVTVDQFDADHNQETAASHFFRFTQGTGNATYSGNFAPGDAVLDNGDEYTFRAGPVTLGFDQGMAGVGAQIQSGNPDAFTAALAVYDQQGNLLASYTEDGDSTRGDDGGAIFLGVVDPADRIYKVTYSLTAASANNLNSFAINEVSLVTVPEPGSPLMGVSITSLLIAVRFRRRRRQA